MGFIEIFLIAAGLSMDAFAVSVCAGISIPVREHKKAVIVGIYFGVFQGGMPLLGYLAGTQLAEKINAFSHWIAFMLLLFIGGKMIWNCLAPGGNKEESAIDAKSVTNPKKMFALAVATSIDALTVGVSFSFLNVDILPSAALIGIVTFMTSFLGVKIGAVFGEKFKKYAELSGGIIVVIIGLKILIDRLIA